MTDSKKLSGDDSERFILPDGEVLTREQMEARLKKKAASSHQTDERSEAQLELAKFYLSIAKPLQAYRVLKAILNSAQPLERHESCKQLLELIRGNRQTPPPERASEQHAEMLIRLGRAFRKSRLTAWDYLRKAASMTKNQDKMAECYLDLGRLSEQEENYEDAVRYYSLAFTMPAGSDRTWYFLNNNLGYSLARLERYAQAETCCRRAIAINPFQYNARKNLGLSLRGQGRFLDAATSFLIASMSCPGDGRAMGHLGEMLEDNPQLRQGIFETLRDRLETPSPAPKRDRRGKAGSRTDILLLSRRSRCKPTGAHWSHLLYFPASALYHGDVISDEEVGFMPQMSLYLNDKTLEDVKAKAVAKKLPVSQVVRLAVEYYLQADERKAAKARVTRFLREKPLGGMKGWAALHKDRTEADDRRG